MSSSPADGMVTYILIGGAVILSILVVLGFVRLCCQKPSVTRVAYPVAISNRLFNDSEIGKELPCLHCQLIEMGEMACYQEFCPHCGRVPPSRKARDDYLLQDNQAGYSRRLEMTTSEKKAKKQPKAPPF